jgi:hypothetical protein
MTTPHKILHTIEHSHYWLVGGFWMLCGLACVVNMFVGSDSWLQPVWIKLTVGLPYLLVGFGFCFQRRLARWLMIPLVILALLACLDGWLCGAWCGNQHLVRFCLVGFTVIIYSLWFIGWSVFRVFQPSDS